MVKYITTSEYRRVTESTCDLATLMNSCNVCKERTKVSQMHIKCKPDDKPYKPGLASWMQCDEKVAHF